ncbi:MAG: hypothetical protein AAFU64_11285 [Bacteroidota bacterium]
MNVFQHRQGWKVTFIVFSFGLFAYLPAQEKYANLAEMKIQ